MAQRKHTTSQVLTINRTRTEAHDKPDTVTLMLREGIYKRDMFKNINLGLVQIF